MKTYDEKQIREIFKKQKYKYACLKNEEGKSIVTYNTESNTKVTAVHKVDESFERLSVLPDGFYTFCFANSKGRNVQPDEFVFVKGNIAIDDAGKRQSFQVIHQPAAKSNEYDKILSYPEVLKLQMENTTLQFQLDATNKELAKANAEIVALEAEIKALEAKDLGEGEDKIKSWLDTIGTNLLPVWDRMQNNREKELSLRERELSLQERAGYRPRPQQKQQQKKVKLPDIGSPAFEEWLDKLELMPDEQYQRAMAAIKQHSIDHYNAIISELEGEEEEESEETQD